MSGTREWLRDLLDSSIRACLNESDRERFYANNVDLDDEKDLLRIIAGYSLLTYFRVCGVEKNTRAYLEALTAHNKKYGFFLDKVCKELDRVSRDFEDGESWR